MTDTATQDQCFHSVPTRRERFWRWAGFRYHLGEADDPTAADLMPSWMKTDMHMHFGWIDRLRLLVSGKLFIASVVHTDMPSPMVCKSRMDWRILNPGENFPARIMQKSVEATVPR